eukprot:CAMPEP_0202711300 /NCGR_PEP_ID=MMETSP1385-20130828/23131_1 /ASSEMBLY_ACC=CAM_ASM_000861 /TAXON_ID=933848 /ORGANISM="Elphidium margaritaceum" /LENGTH=547 /DNA_ID=CAMNT_0049371009 /DNA_START=1177 /DNA_END=2820 /DNA_ORIENTATION=+
MATVYVLISALVNFFIGGLAEELPISTTDVFIQSGEISEFAANVMARCNDDVSSAAKLFVNDEFAQELAINSSTDYTATFKLEDLESNSIYRYMVECKDANAGVSTTSVEGMFRTAPAADDTVALSFVWAADLAGQGYGRNPYFELTTVAGKTVQGGYIVFDTMEALEPDFALFQGDMIYADDAIPAMKPYTNGSGGAWLGNWTNNPSKDFVAVTLEEFRANWKYNFGDDKMQSFLTKVPVFAQMDDHEVANNWWPGEILDGSGFYENGTSVDDLYANSLRAFYEFNPIEDGSLLYRNQRFGKHLEIFFPDYRSYRGPNSDNDNEGLVAMMGEEQLEWLKDGLKSSTATWKVISSHDPFGMVTGGPGDSDSFSQGDTRILGRELEVLELLSTIHENNITGVVSITSDVHFTAAVSMSPERAEGGFTAFRELNEFVIGPIHAGSFGPYFMDASFGAQYEYELGPLTLGYDRYASLPPEIFTLQSFGQAAVSEDGTLEIKLIGIDGSVKFEKTLYAPGYDEDDVESAAASPAVFFVSAFIACRFAFIFL